MPRVMKEDFPLNESECHHAKSRLVRLKTRSVRWLGCRGCGRRWEVDTLACWEFYRLELGLPLEDSLNPMPDGELHHG